MDLYDIFSGQESWHARRLLELAGTLNDEQLDRALSNQVKIFPWDGPDQSLRQILDRMVLTKEVWAAALTGGSMPSMDHPAAERFLQAADRPVHEDGRRQRRGEVLSALGERARHCA